ncbi:MAG: MOSC domain-containing protein [Chloroflexota bacterium]
MRNLARIHTTPLKGAALQHPEGVHLGPLGITWNRRFFLVDASGGLFSGGRHGPLVRLDAALDPEAGSLTIRFPDGASITAPVDRLGEEHSTDLWGRPVPGRFVEGPLGAAIGSFVGQPLRLVRADADGDGPDVHRLSLVSEASVRELGSRSDRPDLDARRFRMNLELGGCEPFEEDGWTGRRVRVGGAVIRVLGQVPRCVVTTHDPATGVKDLDTLKRIAEVRPLMPNRGGVPFGMYAEVEEPGWVAVGDVVEPLG